MLTGLLQRIQFRNNLVEKMHRQGKTDGVVCVYTVSMSSLETSLTQHLHALTNPESPQISLFKSFYRAQSPASSSFASGVQWVG